MEHRAGDLRARRRWLLGLDPARNYWKRRGNLDVQERLPGYVFTPKEVWDELKVDVDGHETIVCNGLIRDWASWIKADASEAGIMASALGLLSPAGEDELAPGPLVRISLEDSRDIPSLKTRMAHRCRFFMPLRGSGA